MRPRARSGDARWLLATCLLLGCGESARTSGDEPAGSVVLTLIDEISQPIPRAGLLVNGAVLATDASGRATAEGVPAKYDVTVVAGGTAYSFIGLTTRSPELALLDLASPELTSYATIDLENPPDLRDDQSIAFIAGAPGLAAGEQAVAFDYGADGLYAQTTWPGTAQRTLSGEALVAELDATKDSVVGYSAYAAQTFELSPDDQVTWQPTFGALPFESAQIHVDLEQQDDAGPATFGSTVHEADGPSGELGWATGVASADLEVLDIPGASYTVTAQSYPGSGTFVAIANDVEVGGSVLLHTASPPELLSPANGARVEPDTEFRWSAIDGAVYRLVVYTDDETQPFLQYEVVTAEPAAKLPDLSLLGLAFPAGRNLVWTVNSAHGPASVDDEVANVPWSGFGVATSRIAAGEP